MEKLLKLLCFGKAISTGELLERRRARRRELRYGLVETTTSRSLPVTVLIPQLQERPQAA